jgi:hypothetical protein
LITRRCTIAILSVCIAACSTAKLEARLEANPQCKDTVNPKTGALMPCPGSDKTFYQSVGLGSAKPTEAAASPVAVTANTITAKPESSIDTSSKQVTPTAPSPDCKPSLHKKTGGILPCPSPN